MWKPRLSFSVSLLIVSLNIWTVFSVAKQHCSDTDPTAKCIGWKNVGYCDEDSQYSDYMSDACNETCGRCPTHRRCPHNQFSCLDGLPRCVHINALCDGTVDCETGHDEDDCDWKPDNNNSSVLRPTTVRNFENTTDEPITNVKPDTSGNDDDAIVDINVEDAVTIVQLTEVKVAIDCKEGKDHLVCSAKDHTCIRIEFWCDGWIADCSNGEDENPDSCYKKINRQYIRETYRSNKTTVADFYKTLEEGMRLTHCIKRSFSCKDACTDAVDLNSNLCACDEDCWAREDCCYDVEEMCEHAKPNHIVERCSPSLFGVDTEISALVIDRCPSSATEHDARLCGEHDNNELVQYYGAPVYSTDSDKHYRNYYCARCNGVDTNNLVPWNVWYRCRSTENDISDECNSLVYIPRLSHHYTEPKTCKRREFMDPSFEDTIITVSEREGLAVERCKNLYAPVKYNDTLYRNPYCVFLHRSQKSDRNRTRLLTCDINKQISTCPEGTRPCRPTFTCIPEDKICDGKSDCSDDSDEPYEECHHKECYGKFRCKTTQHQCIESTKVCDGYSNDCQDKSDEADELCDDERTNDIVYRNSIYNSLPGVSEYPSISNLYVGKTEFENMEFLVDKPDAVTKKVPKCIKPLVFDGVNCKYNKTLTTNNKDYQKVYIKQDLKTIAYNFTLTRLGYYRPEILSDNPAVFLTRHVGEHPYQIVDFSMGDASSHGTIEATLSLRLLTQLEQSESVGKFNRTKRDKENYIQVGKEVYEVTTKFAKTYSEVKQLNTLIDCQYDHSGPFIQVICTGCAYHEYSRREYTITTTGSIELNSGKQILHYYEYELRANDTILVCWGTSNSDNLDVTFTSRGVWLTVWFGVGYALALVLHLIAININVFYGRKTTLRIFLINYTSMAIIWCLDAFLCTVSNAYSRAGQSLHVLGNLGTLAWLLIISFHLLLSVSDGSPAVYFSVDNLAYYHVCGWICPIGWVFLFFFLSTFNVIESVTSLTDPRRDLFFNQSTQILHFPIWVLILVILLLLLIVIGTTKRLMARKSSKVDLDVMGCRLQIKMMVLVLFALQALPWICSLFLKYIAVHFMYFNVIFCLGCVLEGCYLIYMLRSLVHGNLEKLQISPPTPDLSQKVILDIPPNGTPPFHAGAGGTPDLKPALPPKQNRTPRPPLYQRPVEREYTLFPGQRGSGKEKYTEQDQYSHLHGGNLGGGRNGKKKEYYPMTTLGTPAYSGGSGPPPPQHQYMPLVRSEMNKSPAAVRDRQRTTSSQSSTIVHPEPGYMPTTPLNDKGKHRIPRSALHVDQSMTPPGQQRVTELNPPSYRLSTYLSEDIQPCSGTEGQSSEAHNSPPTENNIPGGLPPSYSQSLMDLGSTPGSAGAGSFNSSHI